MGFALLIPFLPLRAMAAAYHVSASDGDDASPGTEAQPWRTLAKVNGVALSPGDQILFKRGDTWTGTTLAVSSSGNAGAPITYGAYGSGAKPVLDPGSENDDVLLIRGKKYVVVQDLDLRRGFGGVRCVGDSAYVDLLRLDVSDSKGTGISLRQSSHVRVDGCTVVRAGNCGILMHGGPELPKVNHCTVQNCTVSDLKSNDGIVIHQDTRGNGAGENFLIRHNVCFNCPEQGFDITAGGQVILEDNVSHDNHGGSFDISHTSHHVTVRRHNSYNEPTSGSSNLRIGSPFVTVEYSRFSGPVNPNPAKNVAVVVINPGMESQPEDVRLFNNVVLWTAPRPGTLVRLTGGGGRTPAKVTLQHLTMRNNILVSLAPEGGNLVFRDLTHPLDSAGFDIDHNLYFTAGAGAVTWTVEGAPLDFAAYRQAFRHDAHGQVADPLFVNPAAGDFHLRPASPAIDAGAEVGLSRDAAGFAVPQGGEPDLGAYEFSSASVAPSAKR